MNGRVVAHAKECEELEEKDEKKEEICNAIGTHAPENDNDGGAGKRYAGGEQSELKAARKRVLQVCDTTFPIQFLTCDVGIVCPRLSRRDTPLVTAVSLKWRAPCAAWALLVGEKGG